MVSPLRAYKIANAKIGGIENLSPADVSLKWKNPPHGCYKINWDVAIDSVTKRTGIKIIGRDYPGQVIATMSHTHCYISKPVVVMLEGDELLIVNAINASELNLSRYGQIVEDTKRRVILKVTIKMR